MDSPSGMAPRGQRRRQSPNKRQHDALLLYLEKRSRVSTYQARVEAAQENYCKERRSPIKVKPPRPPSPERPDPPPKPCCSCAPLIKLLVAGARAAARVARRVQRVCPCCKPKVPKKVPRFHETEIAQKVGGSLESHQLVLKVTGWSTRLVKP